ncbi:MAG: alpha/beta hydrolase [Nocardioidaceae bacterium]
MSEPTVDGFVARPVTVGDLTFDVRFAGPEQGTPVLLLHGFPQTSLCWAGIAPTLADAGCRVIAPDQRGYSPGARPEGVEHYDTRLLAGDVLALAEELGIDAFHLVGHDWGASVAWVVAAEHPDRLRGLTAVSVPHLAAYGQALRDDPDQQQRSAYIQFFRIAGKAERVLLEDGARRLREMYGDAVPTDHADAYLARLSEEGALTATLNWYRAMRADLVELGPVTVPTTYVWSDQDLALGRVGAELCGQHVSGAYDFVELSGISHWVPEQAPGQLAAAILDRVASTG